MTSLRNIYHKLWVWWHENHRIDIWRGDANRVDYEDRSRISNQHRIARDYHLSRIKS